MAVAGRIWNLEIAARLRAVWSDGDPEIFHSLRRFMAILMPLSLVGPVGVRGAHHASRSLRRLFAAE